MAGFGHYATIGSGHSLQQLGVGDLLVRDGPEGPRLYAFTLDGRQLKAFEIEPDGDLRHLGTQVIGDEVRVGVAPQLVEMETSGGTMLATAGLGLGTGGGHLLDGQGRAGPAEGGNLSLPDDLGGVITVETASGTFAYGLRPGDPGIHAFEMAGGTAIRIGGAALARADTPTTLAAAEVDGQAFVVAGSLDGDAVVVHRVASSGALATVARVGAEEGLGLADPSALVTAQVDGATYVVVAGSGSGSLSVMELMPSGSLRVTDHVLDDRDTRFADATAIEPITVGERTWLAVTGSDDGITLLALLPGGRLQPVDTIADTNGASLQNITALAAWADDGTAMLWTLSGSEAGLTQVELDLGTPGLAREGTAGADTLTGGADDDALAGGAGHDWIQGNAGDDVLLDGAGRDTLWGGAGADTFVLDHDGDVDDIRDFDIAEDRLDLSGFLFLYDVSQLTLSDRAWGVEITFRDETVRVFAADGTAVTAAMLAEADLIPVDRPPLGGVASALEGSAAAEWLAGGFAADTLHGMGGDDTLRGGYGEDGLWGGDGDDDLFGGEDGDRLSGGEGGDRLDGGTGHDLLDGDAGDDALVGGTGDDTLRGGAGRDDLAGGEGADRLEGGDARDTIAGGAGDDIGFGGTDRDSMDGGDGDDVLYGEDDGDWIDGGVGHDRLFGNHGADLLRGEAGDDALRGGDQRDTLDGGAGDDSLYGGEGNDTLDGGADHDVLFGDAGADHLTGGDGDDDLSGNDGEDVLWGGDGADTMDGGAQRDTLDGGLGADVMSGGQGADSLYGDDGNDTLFGDEEEDYLNGGRGHDRLDGGRNSDMMHGAGGNDSLVGGHGNDSLYGNAGDDMLVGGWGDDVMIGGTGDDSMVGGTHRDTFRVGDGEGHDTIRDFDPDQPGEVIDLTGVNAIAGWSDLSANHMTDTDDGLLIDLGPNASLLLQGVRIANVTAQDFDL